MEVETFLRLLTGLTRWNATTCHTIGWVWRHKSFQTQKDCQVSRLTLTAISRSLSHPSIWTEKED